MRHYVSRPYQRPASTIPRVSATSHLSSSRRDSSQPPAPPYVVLALEDTFRISARGNNGIVTTSSSTVPSRLRQALRNVPSEGGVAEDVFGAFSTPAGGEDDEESGDLVVIPALGDPEVEDDVRTLLGRHGLQTRRIQDEFGDNEEDERMEIDELDMDVDSMDAGAGMRPVSVGPEPESEWDCVSSHAPSRTSSPPPGVVSGNRWRMWPSVEPVTQEEQELEEEDEEDTYGGQQCTSSDSLDIAGTCFDPSGAYIYVGTTESVAEWKVRGAEKRWWLDEGNEWC